MFVTFYRSLSRHRLFATLSIGGLAIGIAAFLLLLLFVRFETGFDRGLPGADRLWTIQQTLVIPGVPDMSIPPQLDMLPTLQAEFADIRGTRARARTVVVEVGTSGVSVPFAEVDPNYFTLFRHSVLEGSPVAVLAQPDGVVVTDGFARAHLAGGSRIGQTIRVAMEGKRRLLRVGAVVADAPANSTWRHDLFVMLPPPPPPANAFERPVADTFLFFPDATAADRLAAQLPAFTRRHAPPWKSRLGGPVVRQKLVPIASLRLEEPRDRAIVAALAAVGLLTLVLAMVNYVNLATARADLRAREVAIRKVVGGDRRALTLQFLVEAVATTALAALLGLALAELALPFLNAAAGLTLAIRYTGAESILVPTLGLVLVVGIVAGAYPAFVLSRFRPAAVLASARAPGGPRAGRRLRQALVVGQFGIAVALMIGTAVLVAQTRHLQSSDLGFRREGLILVPALGDPLLDTAQRAALLRVLAALPSVERVGRSAIIPTGGSFAIAPRMRREGGGEMQATLVETDVGPGFFATYEPRLIAGRLFDLDRVPADESSVADRSTPATPAVKVETNIVINRTAASRLGFADPGHVVGAVLLSDGGKGRSRVIGVIDDMRFRSPRDRVDAQLYRHVGTDRFPAVATVRQRSGTDTAALIDAIDAATRRIAPGVGANAISVDRKLYDAFYRADDQRARLFTAGAVLAVLIGCVGLYGLAAFDTRRRVREIGIRKALGASSGEVMRLLVWQFLLPVLVATLIAWPLAFVAMRRWLAGFDDRIALSPLFFVGASLLALVIAAATVAGQAWRVARAEPARALREA